MASPTHSDSTYESDDDRAPAPSRTEPLRQLATTPIAAAAQVLESAAGIVGKTVASASEGVFGASNPAQDIKNNHPMNNEGNTNASASNNLLATLTHQAVETGKAIEHAAESAVGAVASALGLGTVSGLVNNAEKGKGVEEGVVGLPIAGFEIAPEAEGSGIQAETAPIETSTTANDENHGSSSSEPIPPHSNPQDDENSTWAAAQEDANALTSEDILSALANAATDQADKEQAEREGIPRRVRFEKGWELHGVSPFCLSLNPWTQVSKE